MHDLYQKPYYISYLCIHYSFQKISIGVTAALLLNPNGFVLNTMTECQLLSTGEKDGPEKENQFLNTMESCRAALGFNPVGFLIHQHY